MNVEPTRPTSYYRRDHIDLAATLSRGPLKTPLHYQFNVTNACNMKCFFCPLSLEDEYKKMSGGLTFLGLDDFNMALGQMQELGRAKVLSYYLIGESFVNKNFIPMLRLAKEANVADLMTATSNSSLLTAEKWGPLCESGLDMLRCSIMGNDEQKYKERGNSGVTLAKVMANISGLKNFRDTHGYKTPHICLRTHTTTKSESDEFKTKFDGVGDEMVVDFLFDWNGAMGKDEQGRGMFSKVTDEEMYGMQPQFFHENKQCCPYPFYTLIVLSDMKVTICSTDWAHWNTVGDLRKETLSEIWHGEKIKEFRRMHLQHRRCDLAACKNCGFVRNTRSEDNLDHLTEEILGGDPKRMVSWTPVT